MSWNERYRLLQEGETILATDEFLDDSGKWVQPKLSVGLPAPDPQYTSHRQFRRLIDDPTTAPRDAEQRETGQDAEREEEKV